MKKKLTALALSALLALSCAACGNTAATPSSSANVSAQTVSAVSPDETFTERDFEVGYSDYVTVTLADGASSADGSGVSIDGDSVTITQEGTYLLTGSLTDGQVVVKVADTAKVQLVLKDVSISNASSAAIYVLQADKVFVTMAEGSKNALSVTGDFVQTDDNNVDGAIFSKADLTLNGNGTLTVSDEFGHGIVCKDDLVVTSGTYTITSASHGLSGKDSVRIAEGTVSITAGKDGVHAENKDDATLGFIYITGGSFTITATNDGFDAASTLTVLDGTFEITTGGGSANASTKADGQANDGWGRWGMRDDPNSAASPDTSTVATTTGVSATTLAATDTATADTSAGDATATEAASTSAKGLKSGTATTLSGGTFTIDSSDDALHTNGDLTISGGAFTIASGDDGAHADATLAISSGTIDISKSYEGIEAAEIDISGGTISLLSSDDGLNAAGGNDSSSTDGRMGQNAFDADTSAIINISGGELTIDAGGDGIDSNGSLTISGGTTYVSGPTNSGNGALDYNSSAEISGGVIVAVGAVGMEQNFSGGTQGAILYDLSASQSAATTVTLTNSDGTLLASFIPTKQYQSVIISAPGIASGNTYTLTAGSETNTIEMTDTLYSNGGNGTGGMMGGHGGGGKGERPTTTDGTAPTPPSGQPGERPDRGDATTGATTKSGASSGATTGNSAV